MLDEFSSKRSLFFEVNKPITYVYDRQKELPFKIHFGPIHPLSHSPLFFEFRVHPRLLEFHRLIPIHLSAWLRNFSSSPFALIGEFCYDLFDPLVPLCSSYLLG